MAEGIKYCRKCGNQLNKNAKFCRYCGYQFQMKQEDKPVVNLCPKWGNENAASAKFCRYCGNSLGTVYQPQRPSAQGARMIGPERYVQKNPVRANQDTAFGKKNTVRRSFTKLVAAVLVLCIIVTGFIKPGFFLKDRKGIDDSGGSPVLFSQTESSGQAGFSTQVVSSDSAKVSLEAPAVTLCGVTLDVDELMLKDRSWNVSVSVLKDGIDKDGARYESYELGMDGAKDFYVPVEVTFPCTVSADTDVVVEHYVDGSWMPLISYVNEEAETVTAYFGSFSPARVCYRPVGINPALFYIEDGDDPYNQTVKVRSNYWNILKRTNPAEYSDEVTRFIDDPDNYAVELPKLDPDMDVKAAYESFSKANTLWGFCDPLINIGMEGLPMTSQSRVVNFLSDHASDLGRAMNLIPFLTMTAQVVYDMRDMDLNQIETAGINLYKNLINSSGTIYSMVTGYSHIGFTLAFFGVALFGMELDYFVEAAKAEQAANVKAVFEAYYNEIEPFDSDHWFQVFYDAYWKTDGNPDAAMALVKKAVDDYCSKFWSEIYKETNEDILFAADAAGYKNVFFNATKEMKAALTEQQKARVWRLIETKSMKKIQRFLLEQLQTNTRKELAKMAEPYNRKLDFQIGETVDLQSSDVARYKGCTLAFGSDGVPVSGWHQNIPDSEEYDGGWVTDFTCTMYGYLSMGMPNQVLVYASENDFSSGALPIFTKEFTPQMDGNRFTEIELGNQAYLEVPSIDENLASRNHPLDLLLGRGEADFNNHLLLKSDGRLSLTIPEVDEYMVGEDDWYHETIQRKGMELEGHVLSCDERINLDGKRIIWISGIIDKGGPYYCYRISTSKNDEEHGNSGDHSIREITKLKIGTGTERWSDVSNFYLYYWPEDGYCSISVNLHGDINRKEWRNNEQPYTEIREDDSIDIGFVSSSEEHKLNLIKMPP